MIEATRSDGGQSRAKCVCDDCGAEIIIPVHHERRRGAGVDHVRVDVGAANKKLSALGWSVRRGEIFPDCVARHKAAPIPTPQEKVEPMMQTIAPEAHVAQTPLREPTPKQKREIIGLLEVVYDDNGKRYRQGESDKTVASACGDGVLFGWVAQIREELFGPDMRNQEVEAIRKDLSKVAEDLAAHQAELREAKAAAKSVEGKVNALVAQMAALKSRLDKAA